MNQIIVWVAAVIFIEAVVEIEVESEIFMIIRDKLSRLKVFGWYLNGLLSCGYCLSVWVSAAVALVVPTELVQLQWGVISWMANYVLKIFILHRLANMWHEAVHRWINKEAFILAFMKDEEECGPRRATTGLPKFIGGDDGDDSTAGDTGRDDTQRVGIEENVVDIRAGEREPGEEDLTGQFRETESQDGSE
jgi:hypothetical protein